MIKDNKCLLYTDFIENFCSYSKWLNKLILYVDELSNNIDNYSPSLPDYEKPNRFYNNFEIYCRNLFDDHEWVYNNYFDKPEDNKCLRCNECVGEYYHHLNDISINYLRLLNIKNSLNKLIYSKENNEHYQIDINPIWTKKLSKQIEKKGIKNQYKLNYGKMWWIYYYYPNFNISNLIKSNINSSEINSSENFNSNEQNSDSNSINSNDIYIEDTLDEIIESINN